MTAGQRIKKYREDKGISKYRLAKLSGISEGAISLIESGKRKEPTVDTLLKIARALDISAWELIKHDGT